MTRKQGGLGRHGYGRKLNQRAPCNAGENGKQAAARIAASTSAAAPALGDATDGYFYVVKFTSAAYVYELENELDSDWGMLPAGTLVLDAQHTNLLVRARRWFGPNPHTVTVPAEQLLHAMFDMAPAPLTPAVLPERPSAAHRAAVSQGAVELSSDDHDNHGRA